jgi:hypothetical protein
MPGTSGWPPLVPVPPLLMALPPVALSGPIGVGFRVGSELHAAALAPSAASKIVVRK